jgi:hypothetical protein
LKNVKLLSNEPTILFRGLDNIRDALHIKFLDCQNAGRKELHREIRSDAPELSSAEISGEGCCLKKRKNTKYVKSRIGRDSE